MYERTGQALSLTPGEYLAGLQTFLTETATLTAQQQYWLYLCKGILSANQFMECDEKLSDQIEANVTQAGTFIQGLGELGLTVLVRHENGGQQPLRGIAFEPENCQYSLGVLSAEGPTLLPFDGTHQLEIHLGFGS